MDKSVKLTLSHAQFVFCKHSISLKRLFLAEDSYFWLLVVSRNKNDQNEGVLHGTRTLVLGVQKVLFTLVVFALALTLLQSSEQKGWLCNSEFQMYSALSSVQKSVREI